MQIIDTSIINHTEHLSDSFCLSGRCYEESQDSQEHAYGPSRQQGGVDVPGL